MAKLSKKILNNVFPYFAGFVVGAGICLTGAGDWQGALMLAGAVIVGYLYEQAYIVDLEPIPIKTQENQD